MRCFSQAGCYLVGRAQAGEAPYTVAAWRPWSLPHAWDASAFSVACAFDCFAHVNNTVPCLPGTALFTVQNYFTSNRNEVRWEHLKSHKSAFFWVWVCPNGVRSSSALSRACRHIWGPPFPPLPSGCRMRPSLAWYLTYSSSRPHRSTFSLKFADSFNRSFVCLFLHLLIAKGFMRQHFSFS